MLLSAHVAVAGGKRYLLEEYPYGTYCLTFDNPDDQNSTRDDLFDSLADAKQCFAEDFNIALSVWTPLEQHIAIMHSPERHGR